jgi:hypothetical protein
MILIVRKINTHPKQIRNKKVEIRNFKHFIAENFLNYLRNQEWDLLDYLDSNL